LHGLLDSRIMTQRKRSDQPGQMEDGMRKVDLFPRFPVLLTTIAWSIVTPATFADHLKFEAEVRCENVKRACSTGVSGPNTKLGPRATLEVPLGKAITVNWKVTHTAGGPLKDVVIHFFVVKEEKAGQAAIPKLDRDVIAESALTMDFKPGDKQTAELVMQMDVRGTYLLRIESIGAAVGIGEHEDFAVLDLIVK
jgi:hypothetical protein